MLGNLRGFRFFVFPKKSVCYYYKSRGEPHQSQLVGSNLKVFRMGLMKSLWGKQKAFPKSIKAQWLPPKRHNTEDLDRKKAENYILQTNFGIIPFDLWHQKLKDKKDPLEGFSEREIITYKRKFRKLKKIVAQRWKVPYNEVKFTGEWRTEWISRINDFLREREGL